MTPFTAECIGILLALKHLVDTTFNNIYIYTDCLSVINALNSPSFQAHYNPYLSEIKNLIDLKFKNSHRIKMFWIPAHSGICPNEHVDKLAKQATNLDISLEYLCPWSDLSQNFKNQACKNNLDSLLEEATYKGVKYFSLFFKPQKLPWFSNKTLPRNFICWVNRIRSNHYHLGYSLARIGYIQDPKCPCGSEQQDLNHIIWQCPFLNKGRDSLLQSLIKLRYYPPMSIDIFIGQPNIKPLKLIYKFLQNHEIYT
ncbi:uncharacterized protein [Prorops nasuta]|uniref:uncharacterized protein n=1 Tax=Prorops nasuta TaxID=863751 RepID=UPI0034CD5DA7